MKHLKHIYEMDDWATSNKLSDQYLPGKAHEFISQYKKLSKGQERYDLMKTLDLKIEDIAEIFKLDKNLANQASWIFDIYVRNALNLDGSVITNLKNKYR